MVIRVLAGLVMLSAVYGAAANAPLSADELRKRMMATETEKKDSADRLKLLRGNQTQIGSVDETTLFYDLPDGRKVRAVLLPNGRKSPAMPVGKQLKPACVATSGLLVPGEFNPATGKIDCSLSPAEIAYIDDTIYGTSEQATKGAAGAGDAPKAAAPGIDKYATPGAGAANISTAKSGGGTPSQEGRKAAPKQAQAAPRDPNIYMPPVSGGSVKAETVSFTLSAEKPYGIKRGAWGEVRLDRQISSADSGWVEYTLEEDIVGQWRSLPAGTIFFGSKQINTQNRKLESKINLARLPDGTEIKMAGWIYSLNRTAGLNGRLERDREGENSAAAGNAALAGLGAAANQVAGPGNVAGAVVDTYTGDLIANERRYTSQAPKATIHVSPQRALIQFAEPL